MTLSYPEFNVQSINQLSKKINYFSIMLCIVILEKIFMSFIFCIVHNLIFFFTCTLNFLIFLVAETGTHSLYLNTYNFH